MADAKAKIMFIAPLSMGERHIVAYPSRSLTGLGGHLPTFVHWKRLERNFTSHRWPRSMGLLRLMSLRQAGVSPGS